MTRRGPDVIRSAHGNAAAHGAVLVAETPSLAEVPPLNADATAEGLALASRRGRPFQVGNRAASGRGPSLTRIVTDTDAPEEIRRVNRKAASLKQKRERELSIQHGGIVLSTAVRTELVAWARGVAWSEHFARKGDAVKAAALAEKSSAHGLRAIGIAQREADAAPRGGVGGDVPPWFEPNGGSNS